MVGVTSSEGFASVIVKLMQPWQRFALFGCFLYATVIILLVIVLSFVGNVKSVHIVDNL